MLIEFSVENFRSFKEPAVFSMVAANIHSRDRQIDLNNTIPIRDDLTLLRSSAVYGANASGKTNLVKALGFMARIVITSAQSGEGIVIDPHRLSTETAAKPTMFQLVFLADEDQFRYGFEANQTQVVSEWLFKAGTRKEILLFKRDQAGFHIGRSFSEARGLAERTRANALFLSVVAQWNGPIAQKILNWFQTLYLIFSLDDPTSNVFTLNLFKDPAFHDEIINFVKSLDVGIENIQSKLMDKELVLSSLPLEMKDMASRFGDEWTQIQTVHKVFDHENKAVEEVIFDFQGGESHGTQKLFYLAGPILAALKKGYVVVIDELEALLHPLITLEIVRRFNNPETNPNSAQLIFTTQDTNLLSKKWFRRDQIWFVEKDRQGGSHLYSLADLKVRNDASFESDYMTGRYGAIPYLGGVEKISSEEAS